MPNKAKQDDVGEIILAKAKLDPASE